MNKENDATTQTTNKDSELKATIAPSKRFWKIFSLIAGIASLISIPLAFYFWLESKEYPELIFTVHPVKAVLLQKGQTSKLAATFDSKPIETDVSTSQMAIWNRGKKPVTKNEILSENNSIEISSVNRVPILEARIRKSSRDVIQCQLNVDRAAEGIISLSWRVLERNDSCVIQVIYAGNSKEDFIASGSVMQQNNIASLSSPERKLGFYVFLIIQILLSLPTGYFIGYYADTKGKAIFLGVIALSLNTTVSIFALFFMTESYPFIFDAL